jgi:murein DD-endopeptidase MepM/ murein hydrolase activator NlpD
VVVAALAAVVVGLPALPMTPASADAVVPVPSEYPMTMPTSGMVESLVGGGCPSGRSHPGIDISNANGTATEILAAYPGWAYSLNQGDGYGIRVEIVHPFDGGHYLTRYAHLSQAFVSPEGQLVDQGDVIGMMGGTGNAQIVHLHFEIRRGTTPGSDVPLDVNAAFRPCRSLLSAGQPIRIDLAPLTWMPRHDAFVGMDIAALGISSVIPGAEDPVADDTAAPRPAESNHNASFPAWLGSPVDIRRAPWSSSPPRSSR